MKKNIMKVALVAAFTLFAGYSVYTSQKSIDLSALALDNVEALAGGENSDCPNGCLDNGDGCYCYQWYSCYREANW